MLTPYEPARKLRSSGGAFLAVPKSRLKSKCDRAFAVGVTRLWNDLHEEIWLAKSVMSFKSLPKSHILFYQGSTLTLPCLALLGLTVELPVVIIALPSLLCLSKQLLYK